MEDSKKNKERKVLTDEELEQVSGGRVVFWIEEDCRLPHQALCEAHSRIGCVWSHKLGRCFDNAEIMAAEEAKAGVSGAS